MIRIRTMHMGETDRRLIRRYPFGGLISMRARVQRVVMRITAHLPDRSK